MRLKSGSLRYILILLVLCTATTVQAGNPNVRIDNFIKTELPISGAPGVAYSIVEGGKIFSDARGEALIGSGRPITPEMPFLLGSISKSFTALAVMKLVEADKIELDAPISRYLEPFAGQASGSITIRQLLSHTSGYSTLQGNDTPNDARNDRYELLRAVKRIAQWPLPHQPGTRWEYSNANYQILGALIEVVSGQDYARYIETEILKPIGMEQSFVADGESHDTMATGHLPWFGTKRPITERKTNRATAPQGGVIASAHDLAQYLAMMMNGEDDIISAEGKALMLRPASDVSPFYGFGWFIDGEHGTISHTGTSPGFETLATMVPAKKKGVVVLVNAGSGVGFGETAELRNGISAIALGMDYAGDGTHWQQKAVFISLALLPVGFLISIVWAWLHRDKLRVKSGPSGLFSLWFPLFVTLGGAFVFAFLFPQIFSVSLSALKLFLPDLIFLLTATAATGVIWAMFRLGVAYSGGKKS